MSETLDRNRLHTVQLVPLTAFDATGKLNLDPMRKQTERLYAAGIRVFIPCAGSSEFHTMVNEEIVAAIRMTRQTVGSDAIVMVPVGLQLQSAIDLGKRAVDAGANALLVMPLVNPYQSDLGAEDYYEAILESVPVPAIIYKKDLVPSNALLLKLADHPRMVGVKYSMPDISGFHSVVQEDKGRIDWFCGHAERYAPFFMLAGAPGYTSGAGNICPRVTLAMHHALLRGDYQEGLRLQKIIAPIEDYRARDASSYNVSFLKHAIRSIGMDFGQPRAPYRRLTSMEQQEIEAAVAPILRAEAELGG